MRILHARSQRPEATGSGIYVRAMIREAFRTGHEDFLLAGIPSGDRPQLDCLTGDQCSFVHFETDGLPFPVVGMSDVMPYPSQRFSDLTATDLEVYEKCFAESLEDRVQVYGPLPQERLAEIFRRSHLLILPSFYEGLALVLLEAMACGCRLVSTNFPGLEEVLGELPRSYCRLVDLPRLESLDTPFPEDEASFERRLAAAIRDQMKAVRQEPKMDTALLAPILDEYSWPRVFERVEQVYFQALNRSCL